jgi:hypothetical protein
MHVIISGIYHFFNIWDYTYPIEGIQVIIGNYVYVHARHDYWYSYSHINVIRGQIWIVGLCICISGN